MNIIYKVTIEKGWHTFEQKVFKTFYFDDIAYVNDFIFRSQKLQRTKHCTWGKIQMEQMLNCYETLSVTNYRSYAKLVLDMGLFGIDCSSLGRFSKMIDNIVLENSTPIIYLKFKRDYETRIWYTDIVEKNYPRSTRFVCKKSRDLLLKTKGVS